MDDMGKVDWGWSATNDVRELEKRVRMLELVVRDLIVLALNEEPPEARLAKLRQVLGGFR